MVKPIEKGPDWRAILAEHSKEAWEKAQLADTIQLLQKLNQSYSYWDKVRCQPIGKKKDRELLWSILKANRETQLQPLPILNKDGLPFRYWLPDPMPEKLYEIDCKTKQIDQQKHHLIHSLMEEAITSSQVEGAATTMQDAKQMLRSGRKPRNRSEQMIVNNYATMHLLKKMAQQPLSSEVILKIHRSITSKTLSQDNQSGRYRNTTEEVSIENNSGDILFTPPAAEKISSGIDQLCRFANQNSQKIHPLIKAIILHFFLAYLHPFVDGNGRTARALFYWSLLKDGYWFFEFLSISKIILKSLSQYGRAYLYAECDESDLTYFIHYHLKVILSSIDDLHNYLETKQEETFTALDEFPDLNLRQSRLLVHLFQKPKTIISIKEYQKTNAVAYQTARTDLLDLANRGLLEKIGKGKTFHFVLSKKMKSN